jgi:hypothetical protein
MSLNKPDKIPKCNCGGVSEWHYDNLDEEWYESKCWRCLEIQWMKDPSNGILKSLLPWDTDMVDRFIEILTCQSTFLKTFTVKRIDECK